MSLDSALSYFRALRARGPADAEHIEAFGLPLGLTLGSESSREQARRFHALLREEAAELDAVQAVLVETYLFGPATDQSRQRAARERLTELDETSPHYYRNHCTRALEAYCRRLTPRLEAENASPSSSEADDEQAGRWYEIVEMHQELQLDPDNYRRQRFTTTIKIRSRRREHPIVFFRHGWTGSGRSDDAVVLSGQDEERCRRGLEHRLLRERRESDNATSWMLKIFDLGSPLAPGTSATLQFTQAFIDSAGSFQPYLAWANRRHPTCRIITLAVVIPPELGVKEIRAWEEEPNEESPTGYAADAPVATIAADEAGRFKYACRRVRHRRRYMIDWSDGSYNSAHA